MVRAECCTACGHRGLDTGQVTCHHVRIALDHHHLLSLRDRPLGQVDAIEHLGLLVELSFWGIQILGTLIVLVELARTETDDFTGHRVDGPDQPPTESVVETSVALREHAGEFELLVGETLIPQMREQVGPALGRVADAVGARGGVVESALPQELLRGCGLTRVEVALEEFRGDLVRVQQTLPTANFLAFGARALLVAQFVPDARGQPLDRLGERGVVHFHEKRDDIPGFVTAEAVVRAHLRTHVERGCALVVERAQPLVGTDSGGLQGHVLVDNFLEIGA